MKILISVGSLTEGGAERVAAVLANGLADRGHEVVVLTNLRKPITYRLNKKVRAIDFVKESILTCWRPTWRFRKVILTEKPDVLLGFGSYQTLLCKLGQWFSLQNIPVIYSEHNVLERPREVGFSLLEKFYKFYFSRICSAMTVLTQADKDYAGKRLKNLHVMPNPMALTPCESVPVKDKIIIAVGRLNVWYVKGFDLLLVAWGKISSKYPEWKLQIVGGGSEESRDRIRSFAKQSGCEKSLELIPYTSDIASLYQKASIFVLSSRYEGFGLVVTEAMSQGCACIAADFKGRQSEIINHEQDGLLCKVESSDAIADNIERLINNQSLRERLQRVGIESSKRFLPELYAERWERLLIQLCKKV